MQIEINQLLTQSEVAALKRMTLSLLAHHLAKADAPRPVVIGGRRLYRREDIRDWKPATRKSKGAGQPRSNNYKEEL